MEIETFPALQRRGLKHGFSTRSPGPLESLDDEIAAAFSRDGFPMDRAIHAAQPHGNKVALVTGAVNSRVPEVDALITSASGLPLVVRVADCGPLFFYDPKQRVVGVAHSGRRGTEANILGATIERMAREFGSRPEEIIVQLGPCIRPPRYEVDFAAEIGRQARQSGVQEYHDVGTCTAGELDRYYSYRAEKGSTGRMWGVLMLT